MSGKVVLHFGAACGWLITVLPIHAARAEPPPALRVAAPSATCPSARQVATELERVLPRTQITIDGGPSDAPQATVSDRGAQFRVTIGTQARSFDDPSRQCAERARHAAVFLALELDPLLTAELAAEPPLASPPLAAAPAVTARPPIAPQIAPFQWEMTLGGVMHVAPAGEGRNATSAQGIALFARAKRRVHWAFGAGVLHGPLRFDVVAADVWWIPIDLAAGFCTRANAWEIGAELGPNASILSIVGENLSQARRQVRLEMGGRASVWSRFWLSQQFAVFLSAETVVRPFPHVLDVDPKGSVGQTPSLWLGASAGVATFLQ